MTLALLLWNSLRHREPTAAPPADASTQSPAPAPVTAPASRPTQPSRSEASLAAGKASPAGTLSSGKFSGETISAASQAESTTGSASKLSLLIRAEETTRVSIVADGKPVAQETLIAPAHTSVRASREIVVKTGNARCRSRILHGF